MADIVHALLVTNTARRKLGARGIGLDEARQLVRNHHVVARNPHRRPPSERVKQRRLMVGFTNGGRAMTLAIERTVEPNDWLIVTGWDRRITSVGFWRDEYEEEGSLERPGPTAG